MSTAVLATASTPPASENFLTNPVKVITEAKITPSGVVLLAELQGQGYAYIRP